MSLPWKVEVKVHTVDVPGCTPFEVPLYASLLVDEALFVRGIPKDVTSTELAIKTVWFCLRNRGVIDAEMTEEEFTKQAEGSPLAMIEELFDLFIYGIDGKPSAMPKDSGEKKKPTGGKSSGVSSDGIQVVPSLAPVITDVAPSTSSQLPSEPIAKIA